MAILREKINNQRERDIITLSIVSDVFLKSMLPLNPSELFRASVSRIVFDWCAKYFEEFGKAPNKDIQDLYVVHKAALEEDDVDSIAVFLSSLSSSTPDVDNMDYQIKRSLDYLTLRRAERIKEQLEGALAKQSVDEIERIMAGFAVLRSNRADAVDAINSEDEIYAALTEDAETLFDFPGALGDVVGPFTRGDFVAWQAFAKGRKSWFLQYTAQQAYEQGCRVLYVSLEMPKSQILRRLWRGFFMQPKTTKEVSIPFFYKDEEDDEKWHIDYEKELRRGMNPTKESIREWRTEHKKYFRKGSFKIESIPANSMKIAEFLAYVDNLEYYEGFIPDVIVIDYADLFNSSEKENRHKLDDIWKNLRKYSMLKNICIVTASQSGRASAGGDSSTETIAEDIRKVAHVTKLLAINSTAEERGNGLMRIANLASREDASSFDQAYVTTCLDIGLPVLDSRFRSEVVIDKTLSEGD